MMNDNKRIAPDRATIDKLARDLFRLRDESGLKKDKLVGRLAGLLREAGSDITPNRLFKSFGEKNKYVIQNAMIFLASCRMAPDMAHCLSWFRILGGAEWRKAAVVADEILRALNRTMPERSLDLRIERGTRLFEYDIERNGLMHTFVVVAASYGQGIEILASSANPFAEFPFTTAPSSKYMEISDDEIAVLKDSYQKMVNAGRLPAASVADSILAGLAMVEVHGREPDLTIRATLGSFLPWEGLDTGRVDVFSWFARLEDGELVHAWPDAREDDILSVLEMDNDEFSLLVGLSGPINETVRLFERLDELGDTPGTTLMNVANTLVDYLDRWTHWSVKIGDFADKAGLDDKTRKELLACFRLA